MNNLTPEESKGIAEFLTNMAKVMNGESDLCPQCGAEIEEMRQHGRCAYCYPCGCRAWQGTIPDRWKVKK